MPGILWPKFDDQTAAQRLAFTGAIKDDVMDTEALARALGEVLREKYPELLNARYKLSGRAGYPDGYRKGARNARFRRCSGYREGGGNVS